VIKTFPFLIKVAFWAGLRLIVALLRCLFPRRNSPFCTSLEQCAVSSLRRVVNTEHTVDGTPRRAA